jgi:ubiquitin C-terminal hydrolase
MLAAGDHAVERPSAVKAAVGAINRQFAGYGQHDSQEFLRFLLDGLHDDLNRVRVKPAYVAIEDSAGDDDWTKSARWWCNYTERNASVITDTFSGQLKSKVTCLSCGHVSLAFDPFMDLSLPIPGGGGGGGGGVAAARRARDPFGASSAFSLSSRYVVRVLF